MYLETVSDPIGEGLSSTGLSSLPLQMPTASPDCLLCFWPTSYQLEVPMAPSLNSINLLKWLTELRETPYLLDYQFFIKSYNSGTARWDSCMGQSVGKGWGTSMPYPGMSPFMNIHVFINQEAFQTPSFWVMMEALWPRHDWLNHWPLVADWTSSPFPLPGGQGDGTESSKLPIMWLVPWQPASIPRLSRGFPRVSSSTSQKTPVSL